MSESLLISLTLVIVAGAAAQWIAWRAQLPSILLLLAVGILVGPVTGWLDSDRLMGDLMMPFVSVAVALILYEGGLTLRISELRHAGVAVRNLVSVGALVTWLIATAAALLLFKMALPVAALLGAVLIVTGPTVIAPLLRLIRPAGSTGSILKWEGIVIDPIGALAAVILFEILTERSETATSFAMLAVTKTVVIGGGLGLLAGWGLIAVIRRYWVPDYLQNTVSLMLVVAAFAASNAVQHESGLLATTVMGIYLANQRKVDVADIVEFKENLQILLISALFVLLGARLDPNALREILWPSVAFVAVLVFVARPLGVLASTAGAGLNWPDRLFLCWMAPRGIVAAAVASVFSLRMEHYQLPGAEYLVPVTFATIIGTVTIYGLTAPLLARRLGIAEKQPQGVLFVGASPLIRAIAETLQKRGVRVLIVDSNAALISAARMAGLPTYRGSVLGESLLERIDLGGLGRLLTMTANDWVNALAVQRFSPIFGRANCYQVAPAEFSATHRDQHKHLYGRRLFAEYAQIGEMDKAFDRGVRVKATTLTQAFDLAAFREHYGATALPMFLLRPSGRLDIIASDTRLQTQAGDTVIGLVHGSSQANGNSGGVKAS